MKLCKETTIGIALGVLIAMVGIVVTSLIFGTFINSGGKVLAPDEFEEKVGVEISIQTAVHPRSPSARPR